MAKKNITQNNIESHDKNLFISINDTAGAESPPYFSENRANLKVMFFDDTDVDLYVNDKIKCRAFSEEQAKELYEFIAANRDKESCIVHCAAGISRSGAVGAFVNDLFGENFEKFKRNNPFARPAGIVYMMLNRYHRSLEK